MGKIDNFILRDIRNFELSKYLRLRTKVSFGFEPNEAELMSRNDHKEL